MKKLFLLLMFAIIVIFPVGTFASEGLIKPDSSVYFLQNWGESVRYFFTFTKTGKIDYLLTLTDRRTDEIEANSSDVALTEKLAKKYENNYTTLENLSQNVSNKIEISQKITENSLRQQAVLAGVYQKVPEAAQAGILNAQENSSKNVANVVTKVEGENAASDYQKKAAVIQQAGKVGQAGMESGGPSADPSQNTPKSLNGANSINSTNPTNGSNQGVQQVVPAAQN